MIPQGIVPIVISNAMVRHDSYLQTLMYCVPFPSQYQVYRTFIFRQHSSFPGTNAEGGFLFRASPTAGLAGAVSFETEYPRRQTTTERRRCHPLVVTSPHWRRRIKTMVYLASATDSETKSWA